MVVLSNRTGHVVWKLLLGSTVLLLLVVVVAILGSGKSTSTLEQPATTKEPSLPALEIAKGKHLTIWWDQLAVGIQKQVLPSGSSSNIHPKDYVGPQTCQSCHPGNYEAWSAHPHKWMNMPANVQTVRGDFSGTQILSIRGGTAKFEQANGEYRMLLERGAIQRTYRITQTIGSRFYQYYVGRLINGPEPKEHHFYHKDHVLPFGYWLDQNEWIPIVHVGPEREDPLRPDPFNPPDAGRHYAEYAVGCNSCHTTFPLADLLVRKPEQVGEHAKQKLHWSLKSYLQESHPDTVSAMTQLIQKKSNDHPMAAWDAGTYAATFGVSCEACHLGAREHVQREGAIATKFFPNSPYLFVEGPGQLPDRGRTHENINWACGRCHTGNRPSFAAGMSTWNSVEYSDAMRGSCYSQLTCIHCHRPHHALGSKWSLSADQDDALCLKCHPQLASRDQRMAHTHHGMESEGSRCMNCHMPRINEGLNDVVRTHMIYSPTRADMIEANHPNACNLCHTDKPIDWTRQYLREWYGKTYDERHIDTHYRDRTLPVAQGWLKSRNESVRLVAADSLIRMRDPKCLPQLLNALDDPFLLNRQFASKGLQQWFNVRLVDFGYRFYQTETERQKPLEQIRARLLSQTK